MESNPYDIIAPFYDDAGFSSYSGTMASRLLTFLQQHDWIGRRVVDLGCGTGFSTGSFSQAGMETTGIDSSAKMLAMGQRRLLDTGYHVTFVHGDIRAGKLPEEAEMIFCIGSVFNELRSLKEIELVLTHCHQSLLPGKVLAFDMNTIRGLVTQFTEAPEQVLDLTENLFVGVRHNFNYETIALQQHLMCFTQSEEGWERADVTLVTRGYPLSRVRDLVEKVGFKVWDSYDSNLKPFDPQRDSEGRFIIIAEKK